jgi:leucyl aminopeptidase
MPQTKKTQKPVKTLTQVRLLGAATHIDLQDTEIAARAQNLARWLTALAPNQLDAGAYRKLGTAMAKDYGWKARFLGEAQLRKLGAGAFMAVCQGNATRDAGILHLRYEPTKPERKKSLALVGKGILFDTGGNNLKPHKSMLDMHEDMAGSAVALATLQALTELDYPGRVDCWLAITENRISAAAYKPRDIITASNGVTIEIIHTDAEGRMVLADTLALAGREKPALMIDYATLTGACVYALTERYSGVFSNREALHADMVAAGRRSGERVWPFPIDADYDEAIKSKAADVLQCSIDGSGDHILATRFLQRFVPDSCDWIHMDLSAASRKEGLGQVPGGATGFGVRWTLEFLQDRA